MNLQLDCLEKKDKYVVYWLFDTVNPTHPEWGYLTNSYVVYDNKSLMSSALNDCNVSSPGCIIASTSAFLRS